jgi:MYXO-CTERM domain-containing protein
MKTLLFVAVVLALPAAAQAKGPSAASITGPGLFSPITVDAVGHESGFIGQTGFFPATFGQTPDPMLAARPKGDLGPRYTITYTVPGPNNTNSVVRQGLYPYAEGGPVLYTKPGQRFFDGQRTHGGWFRATPDLTRTLVRLGLPKAVPAAESSHKESIAGIAAGAFAAGVAGLVLVRRRRHS